MKHKNSLPSLECVKHYIAKHDAQSWYIYAFEQFRKRRHCYLAYRWIKFNTDKNDAILESGCGCGGMLFHLFSDDYKYLSGYDIDEKAIAAGRDIANSLNAPINLFISDGFNPNIDQKYKVIAGINWIYHVHGYSLDVFLQKHSPFISERGYLIFDVVDISYNTIENNQYHTDDWKKPVHERRNSEYLLRCSCKDISLTAAEYKFTILKIITVANVIPRKIYILQRMESGQQGFENLRKNIKQRLVERFFCLLNAASKYF